MASVRRGRRRPAGLHGRDAAVRDREPAGRENAVRRHDVLGRDDGGDGGGIADRHAGISDGEPSEPSSPARACARAACRAPRSTGSSAAVVAATAGRARQILDTSAATRVARAAPAGLADGAAEDDEAGVENDADRRHADRDPLREVVEERRARGTGRSVSFRRRRRLGRRRGDGVGRGAAAEPVLRGQRLHRQAAGQRLQPGLARMLVADRERRAVHRHPADLARRAADPLAHLAADDRGEAEAGAEPDEGEVIKPDRRAAGPLGHRGQVHVVLDQHRRVQHLAEPVKHALLPGRQVHRQPGRAGPRVEHTGAADHHRGQGLRTDPGVRARLADRLADEADRVVAPVRVHAHLGHLIPGNIRDSHADQVKVHI